MKFSLRRTIAFATSLISLTAAQNISACDYYGGLISSNATLGQTQFITQFLINLFAGNQSIFNGPDVQGILAPATYNGTSIQLLKYFDGSIYSTNTGSPAAVNWLDGGGLVALETGKLASTNTSNQ
jgi:hypothetical protein